MEGRALLIAPIGAPYGWREVEYRAPWARGGEKGHVDSVKSRTSIKLIYEWLLSRGVDVKVIVFALDTLSAYTRYRRGGEEVEGAECLPDPFDDLPEGVVEAGVYRTFMERVGGCIYCWFKRVEQIDVDVRVIPGFGELSYTAAAGDRRRARWKLAEDLEKGGVGPMDYLMALQALHIIDAMQSFFEGCGAEVHVDLTHGINYASYSIYRAVLFASRVYSAASKAPVDITVYNSEPYVEGSGSLNVLIVRRERIKPRAAASRLVYAALSAKGDGGHASLRVPKLVDVSGKCGECKSRIARDLGKTLGKLNNLNRPGWAAAAAITAGAPLLLAQAWAAAQDSGLSVSDLTGYPAKLLELLPVVEVRKGCRQEPPSVEVEHLAALRYGIVKKLAALSSLTLYSSHAVRMGGVRVEERGSSLAGSKAGCKRPRAKVAVASLHALEKIAEYMLVGPSKAIVENEVSNFERAAKGEEAAPDYKLAHEAHRLCGPAEDLGLKQKTLKGDLPDRVFAAHAGLTARVLTVESNCEPDVKHAIKLYYDPCLLDKVYNVSRKLMEDLAEYVFKG